MHDCQIQQVRRFNRLVSQRAGVLEDSYLHRGRPISEARLLYEIGATGADLRVLRQKLGLDSGYASRLLRSLERQGLVQVQTDGGDGRARRASLTAAGRAEVKAYDRLSDGLAKSVLSALLPAQRDRLVAAMGEVERLLRASGVELRRESPTSNDARFCLAAYFRELAVRFETGFDPEQGNVAGDADMAAPAGCFVVARLEGQPVGCGGLKFGDGGMAEIKRMWTAESARGLGIARRILQTLEDVAREHGMATVRLDTNKALLEAHALYRSAGYREIPRFNTNPYAHLWFERTL